MKLALEEMISGEYLQLIAEMSSSCNLKVYLVGGAVRDILLGRRSSDLDFALEGMAEEFPRLFAERIEGSFFWLDRERLQSRVVKRTGEGGVTFDFAPLRGEGIEEDLSLRDFTVNALALELAGASPLIDPLDGKSDLEKRLIRTCCATSLEDDPLRLLRGIRLAATLGFAIEPGTFADIRKKALLLGQVAAERTRDELLQILEAPGVAASLLLLHDAGLLRVLVPGAGREELAESEVAGGIASAARIEQVAGELARHFPDLSQSVAGHLGRGVEGEGTALSFLKLAAFSGGAEGPGRADAWAARLRLGRKGSRMLALLGSDMAPDFAALSALPSSRTMFRFFRDHEPAGVELVLLALARGELSWPFSSGLVRYYFLEYPGADEFLSGDEVMALLGIGQGEAVGVALERLKEAERRGLVNDREEARNFLRKNLLTNGAPMG